MYLEGVSNGAQQREAEMFKIELNNLSLSSHAKKRIKERSKMTEEQMTGFVQNGIVANREFAALEVAVVFWSPVDEMAYVAILNRYDSVVLTVFQAYREGRDGTVRMSMISPDWMGGKVPASIYWTWKVHRHEVRLAMEKAGIQPDIRFTDEGVEEKKNIFASAVVKVKSYSYAEGESVFINRVRFSKGDRDEEPHPNEYFDKLGQKVVNKVGVDDILSVDVTVTISNGSSRSSSSSSTETVFKEWKKTYSANDFFQATIDSLDARAAAEEVDADADAEANS
jgi:hypothetical protein